MKYKMLSSLIVVCILCSGVILYILEKERAEGDPKTVEHDEDVVELTFWRNSGNENFNQAYITLVDEFEATHPHIKINMEANYWGSDYELRLRTEIVADNPPDIMTIDSPNLGLYAKAGSLLSLDARMREEGDIDDILDSTLEGLAYDEEIYLAPIIESSIGLYYNIHLFEEAGIPLPSPVEPMSWNEVLDIAKKINNPSEDIYGIDPAQGFNTGEGPAYFKTPILWQFGGDVLSPDNQTAEGYLNSEESLKALQFYQDLYVEHEVATLQLPPRALETNKLAMTILGSWDLEALQSVEDLTLGKDFGVAPLPVESVRVVPSGGWAVGISSKTKYPDEAWQFVKFLTSYEGSKTFVEMTGDIPARYSVAEAIPELNEYPKNIFVEQVQQYSRIRPITPVYSLVSLAIKELFEDVGIKGEDVEEAADEAVIKINQALEKD
ncbi:ABC transporter substrate-binding protein [Alkalicoccobacillus gibsonii]|uniref:ABC transporter substrate-binding protein n=1 Tax=Alkalicoccobacillus gibsonii TaxID=79881 RepID=UPI003F7CB725